MDARGTQLIAWTPWVFIGFGAMIVLVGVLSAFDEPAALAAIPFGGVFVAIGWFARRLFRAPDGMKAIPVESAEAGIARFDGTSGTRRQGTMIHVPEEADEDAARAAWLGERIARRPDWLARRVLPEGERGGTLLAWGAGIWTAITLAAVAAGLVWNHEAAWAVAVGAGLTGLAPVILMTRQSLHRRKFAASVFAADAMPFRLGGTISGTVETGIVPRRVDDLVFRVALTCTHRWEETRGTGSNRRSVTRHDTLWSGAREVRARTRADGRAVAAVTLDIPADQPPSTLGGGTEGIAWELSVRAPLPGLDYSVDFRLPVLPPGAGVTLPGPPTPSGR